MGNVVVPLIVVKGGSTAVAFHQTRARTLLLRTSTRQRQPVEGWQNPKAMRMKAAATIGANYHFSLIFDRALTCVTFLRFAFRLLHYYWRLQFLGRRRAAIRGFLGQTGVDLHEFVRQ